MDLKLLKTHLCLSLAPSVSLPLNGIDSDRDSGQMTELGGDLASVDSAADPWSIFYFCCLDV